MSRGEREEKRILKEKAGTEEMAFGRQCYDLFIRPGRHPYIERLGSDISSVPAELNLATPDFSLKATRFCSQIGTPHIDLLRIPTARPTSKQQKVKLKYTVSDGELYHEDWRILALNAYQEMAYEPPAVREKKSALRDIEGMRI